MTWSPTSPIRADRAGLGGGRAPADLPTCQSRTGHPHACLLSDPISVCQTARQPSPREERRRVGVGGEGGGGDLIGINYASPHRPAVLLIHEKDERKVGRERERVIEGGEHLKPRAGPSLEVFRVMFLLSLTITFLLLLTLPPVFLSHLDFFRRCALCCLRASTIYQQPPSV